ncbi:hypothetical protein [Bradyrhizobium canariense]|uniref:Uncharacterized protein n=1 Tax=Bradyrhizobium canariense TaxID=255045 RepID=A0A1H1Y1U8_9BRAD|nr:hypothetical protein [Bradyrhizobium canariense]SDT14946.1 hypothetical protein SAMN05444158_4575 [Bradyrhizobium canariense]
MRTLLIGALAAALVGCSCPLKQQASLNSCLDVNESFCFDWAAAREPIEPRPALFATDSAPLGIKPAIAAKVEPPASRIPLSTPTPAKIEPPEIEPGKARSLDNTAADPYATPANTAESPRVDDAVANSDTRAIREQVESAITAAELLTAATLEHSETQLRSDAEKTASQRPNKTDLLVAVLLARPEIKLVPDLTGKIIAIDDVYSASNANVRTAIAAAGATEVQLSEDQAKASDRLVSGEVPAAVLTLVSPEAAEGFPDIAGFKTFRIPLSPRSLKARP